MDNGDRRRSDAGQLRAGSEAHSSALAFLLTAVLFSSFSGPVKDEPLVNLSEWERGIAVTSPHQEDMTVFLWFYEWNMFEALKKGQHTGGTSENEIKVSEDQRSGSVVSSPLGLSLQMGAGVDSADITLTVTNKSDHDWPELASIIPCFNPGPVGRQNEQFLNTKTFFLGPESLSPQVAREIHYNHALRVAVDQEEGTWEADGPVYRWAKEGDKYLWSHKWPRSEIDAHAGLILRESNDGEWVMGIAWERFLSAQGHNPWKCMHLSVNVGPLAQGESREIRGKIYLFKGTKEELLERYQSDFGGD